MNKRLIRIISGAAVGAAASYLLSARNRNGLMSGIKDLSGTLGDSIGGMFGGESKNQGGSSSSGSSSTGSSSTSGRAQNRSTGSRTKSGGSAANRRG